MHGNTQPSMSVLGAIRAEHAYKQMMASREECLTAAREIAGSGVLKMTLLAKALGMSWNALDKRIHKDQILSAQLKLLGLTIVRRPRVAESTKQARKRFWRAYLFVKRKLGWASVTAIAERLGVWPEYACTFLNANKGLKKRMQLRRHPHHRRMAPAQ